MAGRSQGRQRRPGSFRLGRRGFGGLGARGLRGRGGSARYSGGRTPRAVQSGRSRRPAWGAAWRNGRSSAARLTRRSSRYPAAGAASGRRWLAQPKARGRRRVVRVVGLRVVLGGPGGRGGGCVVDGEAHGGDVRAQACLAVQVDPDGALEQIDEEGEVVGDGPHGLVNIYNCWSGCKGFLGGVLGGLRRQEESGH